MWWIGTMISKNIIAGIWLAGFLMMHTAAVASERFVAGIVDLPLMPGLYVAHEETFIFEKLAGRLVRAVAKGNMDKEAFWQFYNETLPQLGWRIDERENFVRDGESLSIKVEEKGPQIIVRFTVVPASN